MNHFRFIYSIFFGQLLLGFDLFIPDGFPLPTPFINSRFQNTISLYLLSTSANLPVSSPYLSDNKVVEMHFLNLVLISAFTFHAVDKRQCVVQSISFLFVSRSDIVVVPKAEMFSFVLFFKPGG